MRQNLHGKPTGEKPSLDDEVMDLRVMKLAALLLFVMVPLAPPAAARVLLKPTGGGSMPLWTRSVKAGVTISGQFASTVLNLTFQNESASQIEADFIYELPAGAVATYFAYWAGKEKVVARIVEKQEAKNIYQRITSWSRDPALVEMTGKNTFRARISPVWPNDDLRVEIHIVQVLPSDAGAATYSLPIYDKDALDPLDSIDVKIHVKPDPSIEKVTTNYGIPVACGANGHEIDLSGEEYRPRKDLNVRIDRKPAKMHASLYAARSGGASGFFSLALMPDHSLSNATVSISGVKTSQLTQTRFARAKAFGPIAVCGRYLGSGKAVATLRGRSPNGSVTYTAPVEFSAAAEQDNPASKLWAAGRIQQLSASRRNRATVIAVSKQFGMPSKYTSWLAVPHQEMQDYKRDRDHDKIEAAIAPLEKAMKANKPDSVVMPLFSRFTQVCTAIGLDPAEELRNYLQYDMVRRLADLVAVGNEDSPEGRMLSGRITGILGLKIDWKDDRFHYAAEDAVYRMCAEVAREQDCDNPDKAKLDSLQARIQHLSELSGHDSAEIMRRATETYASSRYWYAVSKTAKGIRDGKPSELPKKDRERIKQADLVQYVKSEASSVAREIASSVAYDSPGAEVDELRAQLDRLCAYSGQNASELLKGFSRYETQYAARELMCALDTPKPDAKQVASLKARLARAAKLAGQSPEAAIQAVKTRDAAQDAEEEVWRSVGSLLDSVAEGNSSALQLSKLRARYDAACKRQGGDTGAVMLKAGNSRIADMVWQLIAEKAEPNPDAKTIAHLQAGMKRVEQYSGATLAEAMGQSNSDYVLYSLRPLLDQLTAELSRDRANSSRLLRLKSRYDEIAKLPEVAAADRSTSHGNRVSSYGALLNEAVELSLESVAAAKDAESARASGDVPKAADLAKKREEIKARLNARVSDMQYAARRGGDPLISVNAPADALRVVAIMPDGEIKPLAYNSDSGRWEARFDIPTYMPEGEYVIRVIVSLKDGTSKELTLPYSVDLTAPTGAATAVFIDGPGRRIRLDVAASEDTGRVTALMPWGDRVEMRASSERGKFFAVVAVPDGYASSPFKVSFVLLDNAHNRGVLCADVRAQ